MKKPVILAVDDDADMLHAMERDLRRKYGEQYRVMVADSGQSAIDIVRQLRLRADILALFLVDQRMPGMTGVEFLAQVIKDFPEAKRVISAAYTDTEAARRPRNWPLGRKPYLLETNVPGIFVAGDVRHGSIKRVASAVGEGSIAIELIHQYLDHV
jgi:CheY-like chemotaxis protein